MPTEMTPEPQKPARSKRDVASKIYSWLQGRRTARAIKNNAQAITALTATVAAGVAGYGVVEAKQAQHQVAYVAARLRGLETEMLLAKAQMATIRTNVQALDRKSAKALHQLRVDLNSAGITMDRLSLQISSLPSSARVESLARQIAALAKSTDATAKLALAASAAAAEQTDSEARYQASLAADAAGVAGQAARAAQATADAAAAAAETVRLKAEALAAEQATSDAATKAELERLAAAVQAAQDAADAAEGAAGQKATQAQLAAVQAELTAAIAAIPPQDHTYDPITFGVSGKTIADGQTVTFPAGTLVVPADGDYSVSVSFQDGYGCNGDPFALLVGGVAVLSVTNPYGNCNQILRVGRFHTTAGTKDVALRVGCLPPGNGACVVTGTMTLTRIR